MTPRRTGAGAQPAIAHGDPTFGVRGLVRAPSIPHVGDDAVLRESGTLSAIAAVFKDPSRGTVVTVAQVLWEQDEQVREFFALYQGKKSLADLIAGGLTSSEIRRVARNSGWEVHDTFAAYGERLRALLHIPGDKALEVFNRAIGMKEVGDVDAFVRQFMMPSAETFAFIRDTVQPHYRTLLDCWLAIERAERQIALFLPIAEHTDTISRCEARIDAWTRLERLMTPFFATRHLELLRESEADLSGRVSVLGVARDEIAEQVSKWSAERDGVKAKINSSPVGSRLELIDREIVSAEERLRAARQRRENIEKSAGLLGAVGALENGAAFTVSRVSSSVGSPMKRRRPRMPSHDARDTNSPKSRLLPRGAMR